MTGGGDRRREAGSGPAPAVPGDPPQAGADHGGDEAGAGGAPARPGRPDAGGHANEPDTGPKGHGGESAPRPESAARGEGPSPGGDLSSAGRELEPRQPGALPPDRSTRTIEGGPAIADDAVRRPAPAHVAWHRFVWWATTLSVMGALGLGVLIVFLVVDGLIWPHLLAGGIWLAVCGPLAALSMTWPGLAHRHTSYRVSDERLEYSHGVIFRKVTSVPRSRVQHTDVQQGPLERNLDLASLVIHTAGTENATVTLRGLEPGIARRIRNHLLPGGDRDAL